MKMVIESSLQVNIAMKKIRQFKFLDLNLLQQTRFKSPITPNNKCEIVKFQALDTFHPLFKVFYDDFSMFLILELCISYSCNFGTELCQLRIALWFSKTMILANKFCLLLPNIQSNRTQLNNLLTRLHLVVFITCSLHMQTYDKLDRTEVLLWIHLVIFFY